MLSGAVPTTPRAPDHELPQVRSEQPFRHELRLRTYSRPGARCRLLSMACRAESSGICDRQPRHPDALDRRVNRPSRCPLCSSCCSITTVIDFLRQLSTAMGDKLRETASSWLHRGAELIAEQDSALSVHSPQAAVIRHLDAPNHDYTDSLWTSSHLFR